MSVAKSSEKISFFDVRMVHVRDDIRMEYEM